MSIPAEHAFACAIWFGAMSLPVQCAPAAYRFRGRTPVTCADVQDLLPGCTAVPFQDLLIKGKGIDVPEFCIIIRSSSASQRQFRCRYSDSAFAKTSFLKNKTYPETIFSVGFHLVRLMRFERTTFRVGV